MVTIQGLHAAALPLVRAVSITDDATGRTVVDNGPLGLGRAPPPPPVAASPGQAAGASGPLAGLTEAQGRVRMALHGPQGDVNGALLDDGVILRLPPPEANRFATLLQPGADDCRGGKRAGHADGHGDGRAPDRSLARTIESGRRPAGPRSGATPASSAAGTRTAEAITAIGSTGGGDARCRRHRSVVRWPRRSRAAARRQKPLGARLAELPDGRRGQRPRSVSGGVPQGGAPLERE